MSLVLEGTLSEVGLCDLLRLIAREQRSGALRVTIDGRSLRFALRDGQLTGVRSDDAEDGTSVEPAVLALVRHRRGAFRLEPPGTGDPQADLDDLQVDDEVLEAGVHAEALAEAGDMELVRLAERLDAAGGEDLRPERDAFPSPEQMEALDPDARTLYALVNGERSLVELFARSHLDPARVLDALDVLISESMVALAPAEASQAAGPAPLAARASGAWRDLLAAALPIVVLGAWLLLSGPGVRVDPSDPFRIRHDPLAAARAEHELERLRAVLSAHRFAEGRFPERLEALAERGYVSRAALTDASGRPYYYATRGDEFVLLAPER